MSSSEPVSRSLVALYDFVTGQSSLEDTLARIVTVTAESLAADVGGVTMLDEAARAATVGATDPIVAEIDEAQYRPDRGPCLQSMRTGTVVRTDDLRTDGRWPEFARSATAHGILSTLSLPLLTQSRTEGALNVYAARPAAFGHAAEAFGMAFANQAVIGLSYWKQATVAEHLRRALESRAEIEQAKGILIATIGCDPDEAFDLLREQSQSENRKLRDVAVELVARQRRRSD